MTMTTVGFGDDKPRTWQGRLVGSVAMLTGILIIALPVAIVGLKFQEVYDRHQSQSERPRAGDSVAALMITRGQTPEAYLEETSQMQSMVMKMKQLAVHKDDNANVALLEQFGLLASMLDTSEEMSKASKRLDVLEKHRVDALYEKVTGVLEEIAETRARAAAMRAAELQGAMGNLLSGPLKMSMSQGTGYGG